MSVDNVARALAVKPPITVNFVAQADDLASGSVTGGTTTTIVDSSAEWEVDEWKDKVVRLQKNGGADFEFGIIQSNTSDTLTVDSELMIMPCDLCTYRIIPTFVINPCQLNSICAFDLTLNDCALILPKSTVDNERRYIHTYIERGDIQYSLAVLAREDEDVFGAKFYTLDFPQESARVYGHQFLRKHWDLLSVENVKRFANGYFANNESVTSTTYVNLGLATNVVYDNNRRFVPYTRDNYSYLRYTSLYERTFRIQVTASVLKTGAGGELSLALKHRDWETGTETIITDREVSTAFGGGDGLAQLILRSPIVMKRNDELIPVVKRDNGTFSIVAGTAIDIIEF